MNRLIYGTEIFILSFAGYNRPKETTQPIYALLQNKTPTHRKPPHIPVNHCLHHAVHGADGVYTSHS